MYFNKLISLVVALLIVLPFHHAKSEPRFALVIGNSNYANTTFLKNPVNDAQLMAKTLERAGFEVSLTLDADLKTMKRALISFSQTMKEKNEAGLLYYAGHGLQVDGENYLVPIDAVISNEEEIPIETIRVNDFLFMMEKSTSDMKIIILDACRNNPFARSFRSTGGGGLAIVNAPRGSYIAYATSPGAVALDGDGNNSPFTAALAEAISQPELQIEEVFKLTRARVLETTDGKQLPWDTTSITGKFYFNGAPQSTAVKSNKPVLTLGGKKKPIFNPEDWNKVSALLRKSGADLRAKEAKAGWLLIKDNSDVAILKNFASRHPGTAEAGEALARADIITNAFKTRVIEKVGSTDYSPIATFDSWKVYHRDIKDGKSCVTAATPRSSDNPNVKWLFVESFTKSTGRDIRHQFSIGLSKLHAIDKAELVVGDRKFPLKAFTDGIFPKIYLQNSGIVSSLISGSQAWLNLQTKEGVKTAALFNLAGITAALDKMDRNCITLFKD